MESKFSGGLLGLIGITLAEALISLVTFGICVPWGVCIRQRWIAKHTILDGKQMVFDGTGGGLFGQYIKWFLLSIITIGIYALWIPIKMQAWITKNTHLI